MSKLKLKHLLYYLAKHNIIKHSLIFESIMKAPYIAIFLALRTFCKSSPVKQARTCLNAGHRLLVGKLSFAACVKPDKDLGKVLRVRLRYKELSPLANLISTSPPSHLPAPSFRLLPRQYEQHYPYTL